MLFYSILCLAALATSALSLALGAPAEAADISKRDPALQAPDQRHRNCKPWRCPNNGPRYSHPVCKHDECSFDCDDGYEFKHGRCVSNHCKPWRCPDDGPRYSHPVCQNDKCSFDCDDGYKLKRGHCVLDQCKPYECHDGPRHSHPICKYNECSFVSGFNMSQVAA